ncbi:MAG: hypothetical protein PHQ52_05390, partial [Candidatus Omnitrophica bacterium]|nr:hypothetical protein [Candidatus Omnitrophota bacterium]
REYTQGLLDLIYNFDIFSSVSAGAMKRVGTQESEEFTSEHRNKMFSSGKALDHLTDNINGVNITVQVFSTAIVGAYRNTFACHFAEATNTIFIDDEIAYNQALRDEAIYHEMCEIYLKQKYPDLGIKDIHRLASAMQVLKFSKVPGTKLTPFHQFLFDDVLTLQELRELSLEDRDYSFLEKYSDELGINMDLIKTYEKVFKEYAKELQEKSVSAIQRPIIDTSPDLDKITTWINAQPSEELQNIARFISDNITYVDQQQFEDGVQESVRRFSMDCTEPFGLFLLEGKNGEKKSNEWVYALAQEKGLREPDSIVYSVDDDYDRNTEDMLDWLNDNPDINDILFIDDAAYSGDQIYNWVEAIANAWREYVDENDISSEDRELTIHIVVPFMSKDAFDRIESLLDENIPQLNIVVSSPTETMRTMNDIIDSSYFSPEAYGFEDIDVFMEAIDKVFGEDVFRKLLTSFEHKLADSFSIVNFKGTSVFKGPILASGYSETDNINFMPLIETAPYNTDYVSDVKQQVLATEWESRLHSAKDDLKTMQTFEQTNEKATNALTMDLMDKLSKLYDTAAFDIIKTIVQEKVEGSIPLLELLAKGVISWDGQLYKINSLRFLKEDIGNAKRPGASETYVISLLSERSNAEKELLLKKVLVEHVNKDIFATKVSSNILGLTSYTVESLPISDEFSWQLIELLPSEMIAYRDTKSNVDKLVFPAKEKFIVGQSVKINDVEYLLRTFGNILAVEYLLAETDCRMGHILRSKVSGGLFRIDWQFMFQFDDDDLPLLPVVLNGDEEQFIQEVLYSNDKKFHANMISSIKAGIEEVYGKMQDNLLTVPDEKNVTVEQLLNDLFPNEQNLLIEQISKRLSTKDVLLKKLDDIIDQVDADFEKTSMICFKGEIDDALVKKFKTVKFLKIPDLAGVDYIENSIVSNISNRVFFDSDTSSDNFEKVVRAVELQGFMDKIYPVVMDKTLSLEQRLDILKGYLPEAVSLDLENIFNNSASNDMIIQGINESILNGITAQLPQSKPAVLAFEWDTIKDNAKALEQIAALVTAKGVRPVIFGLDEVSPKGLPDGCKYVQVSDLTKVNAKIKASFEGNCSNINIVQKDINISIGDIEDSTSYIFVSATEEDTAREPILDIVQQSISSLHMTLLTEKAFITIIGNYDQADIDTLKRYMKEIGGSFKVMNDAGKAITEIFYSIKATGVSV